MDLLRGLQALALIVWLGVGAYGVVLADEGVMSWTLLGWTSVACGIVGGVSSLLLWLLQRPDAHRPGTPGPERAGP
jgi:hypothetical protein